jgi:hypothetical protein
MLFLKFCMSQHINNFIEFLFRERWKENPENNIRVAQDFVSGRPFKKKSAELAYAEKTDRTILRNRARILGVKINELEKGLLHSDGAPIAKTGSSKKIKHFFIPHKENNYRPHALHPKRIALYSAGAVAMKLILAMTVISYPLDSIFADDASFSRTDALIKTINNERAVLGLNELTENKLLDHIAYLRAQNLLGSEADKSSHTGVSEHMRALGYEYLQVSENIANDFYDPEATVRNLLKSDFGKESLLDKNVDEIGTGVAYSGMKGIGNSTYVILIAKKADAQAYRQAPDSSSTSGKIAFFAASSTIATSTEDTMPAAPQITNLDETSIRRDGNLKLDILAPLADMVVLYVDNEEKILKTLSIDAVNPDNGLYSADLNLAEGQHYILAKSIKGKYERYSGNFILNIDYTPPAIDPESVRFSYSKPTVGRDHELNASAEMSSDTTEATLLLGNYRIPLVQSEENANHYSGSFMVASADTRIVESLMNKAVIIARDNAGNSTVLNLNQGEAASLLAAYKNNSAAILSSDNFLHKLMDSSHLFYKILLAFASILLFLNIFLEIQVQRPGVIFSACGLIIILAIFILI